MIVNLKKIKIDNSLYKFKNTLLSLKVRINLCLFGGWKCFYLLLFVKVLKLEAFRAAVPSNKNA